MNKSTKRMIRFAPSLLLVSASLALPACSNNTAVRSKPISQVAERQDKPRTASTPTETVTASEQSSPAVETTTAQRRATYDAISQTEASGEYVLRDRMADMGEHVAEYTQHVMALSSPFFKGRSADTNGAELAGDYVEDYFRTLGLEPAFPSETLDENYEPVPSNGRSYRMPFSVSGGIEVTASGAQIVKGDEVWELTPDEDFAVLGFSGTDTVVGEIAFVGYSIEDGPDNYTSYSGETDLTGKIAVFFRFEPSDASGKSLWSDGGRWSGNAGLMPKVNAAIDRGAAAVIMIHPPGADDPRIADLPTARTTRFGRPVDVPVIAMSLNAAQDLVEMADPEGRNLYELRRAADKGEIDAPIDLNAGGITLALDAGLEQKRLVTTNVGAVLPGKGALADEWVIIGAHYDHVGFGYLGGARASNAGKLHPGADDNASGTVGLMLSAKMLAERYAEMGDNDDARSVLFIGYAAEEMGLIGSRIHVERMELSPSQVNTMLNMDMIGRLTNNELTVYGIGTSEEFTEGGFLDPHFEQSGLGINRIAQGGNRSDHANYINAGIPSLHFFTGVHPDYHNPGDVASLVNYGGGMRVTELVTEVAFDAATMNGRIPFAEQAPPASRGPSRMNMTVRLGIAPGTYDDDENGVAVGEVYEGTSADEGGIEKGDVMIRWNGEEMGGVRGMMGHLSSHKPGDVANVVVLRDGEEVELKVTLKAREGTR